MRNKIWSLLVVICLLITMVMVIFVKDQTQYIGLEGREASRFLKPTVSNVLDGEFQSNFESAYSDQMIGRETLFKIYKRMESTLDYISSRTHNPFSLYKVGDNIYRFDAAPDYLMEFPTIRSQRTEDNIHLVAENIGELSRKYNDINFYVYDAFRLNMVDWFDEDNFIKSYGREYKQLFSSLLPDSITYKTYCPKDIDEYMKYFYKSDPHWNTYGSYEIGYKGIVDMFNENYGDMEYLTPVGEHVYDDYVYYGQYGRGSLYSTKGDVFSDLKFELPEYTTIVNGDNVRYDHIEEYENGTISEYLWPYIYSNLHGNDEKEVEFIFDGNDTGRNLLCFVDSYASPIKYLIASHFDKAVFIDLRIYRDFNIADYIERYNVTDVLYLEYGGTLYDSAFMINTD